MVHSKSSLYISTLTDIIPSQFLHAVSAFHHLRVQENNLYIYISICNYSFPIAIAMWLIAYKCITKLNIYKIEGTLTLTLFIMENPV